MKSGLYIHIPFCEQKCHYCNFYSRDEPEAVRVRYVESVIKELEVYARDPMWLGPVFQSLYFGGGTPSLLTPAHVAQIIRAARSFLTFHADSEITLEANPGTVNQGKLRAFRAAGINRLSLGAQSFYDDELRQLGRAHTVSQTTDCFQGARRCGFDNISLDLIMGIPGQDRVRWRDSLARLVDLGPEHASIYELTYEAGTPFTRWRDSGELIPADEDLIPDLYDATHEAMAAAGFEHYEVSNYGQPGRHSRHNWLYWNGSPFLGLGASAHSYDGQQRWWNARSLDEYLIALDGGKLPVEGRETLDAEQRLMEDLHLGLRTERGVDMAAMAERHGEAIRDRFQKVVDEGATDADDSLWTVEGDIFRLTPKGYRFCDEITVRLAAG